MLVYLFRLMRRLVITFREVDRYSRLKEIYHFVKGIYHKFITNM